MKAMYHVLIICIIFGFGNCKKFVQIDPPTTSLVTSSVFSNNAAATSAQTVIYSMIADNNESGNMAVDLGLLGDELTNYSTSSTNVQFYTNNMAASTAVGPWKNAYKYIYQVNAVISGVQGNSSLSPSVIQQLMGEAKFLRAFWYFYLTNLYGDVPLVLSPDYSTNGSLTRTAQSGVYGQIVADLKDAKLLLNSSYINASDTTVVVGDRTRPTKWAADALLARVYLYMGDNDDAEKESDSVIGKTDLYTLYSDLNSVFLVGSTEAIWQIGIPLPTTVNTYDGYYFILNSAPGSQDCCSLSSQLLKSFEPGDARRVKWVDSFVTKSIPAVTYYYPFKYKVYKSSTVSENVMVLRLAEQYLIRAEARANTGDLNGAIDDLNVIRNRAGLANYSKSVDQTSVLTAILHERQVELFTEWGHRWLDIIRTHSVDSIMGSPGNVTQFKSGATRTWDDHDSLFPIPQTEITSDLNLTQNPGY